ncbi:MAG: transposase, partial [Clostridia bacterium]|nr:transposase [Clostridia bacterium]
RKVIYTTNAIESLNSALRKVTKGKGSFINKNALMKVLYLRIKDLQKKWSTGIANWVNVKRELAEIYEDRFLKYIEK